MERSVMSKYFRDKLNVQVTECTHVCQQRVFGSGHVSPVLLYIVVINNLFHGLVHTPYPYANVLLLLLQFENIKIILITHHISYHIMSLNDLLLILSISVPFSSTQMSAHSLAPTINTYQYQLVDTNLLITLRYMTDWYKQVQQEKGRLGSYSSMELTLVDMSIHLSACYPVQLGLLMITNHNFTIDYLKKTLLPLRLDYPQCNI